MSLKDIAEEAGVSVSTVSRVLNNKTSRQNVPSHDKIWEIVKREGYVPNQNAQMLRMSSGTQLSPKVISCVLARTTIVDDDPFFQQLARSVDEQAYKENYIVKHLYTQKDFLYGNNIETISDSKSSGILIMGRCDNSLLKTLKKNFKYVGYTGLNYLNAKYDQTTCNGLKASETATNYLINLGHKKIAYIGETVNENRYLGFLNALNSNNIPVNNNYISNQKLSMDGGYAGAMQLLSDASDITAIFCANDSTAIGAIRALRSAKKRIPKDISVIGIDDISMSNYVSPALTTVHIPITELGQISVRVLIDRIRGNHDLPMHIDLPFYLIERDSCAPPSK